MFDVRYSRKFISSALLLTALVSACGGDKATGPGDGSIDPNHVAQAHSSIQSALDTPVLQSFLFGMGGDAFAAPTTRMRDVDARATGGAVSGAQFQRALRSVLSAPVFAAAPGERDSWFVDPELWGKTLVRKTAGGMLEVDPNGTGAPARGVRVMLYRVSNGQPSTTVVGSLDLIDNSTATQLIGNAVVKDAQGTSVATFDIKSAGFTSATVAESFSGTIGTGSKTFIVADTMSGTRRTDGSMTVRWRSVSKAPFANVEYDMLITGYDDGGDDVTAAQATLKFVVGNTTTRVEGASQVGGSGTTNVYINDQLVAKVTYDENGDEDAITGPNGGAVPQRTLQYVSSAFGLMATLPNPMFLHLFLFLPFIF